MRIHREKTEIKQRKDVNRNNFLYLSSIERKNKQFKILELFIWFVLATSVSIPELSIFVMTLPYIEPDYMIKLYNKLVVSVLIMLTPPLYKLIFNQYPLEYLRSKKQGHQFTNKNITKIDVIKETKEKEDRTYDDDVLYKFVNESNELANKIYVRSGVYLLIGILIAITGIATFFSPLLGQYKLVDGTTTIDKLLNYLPRISALILVETLAFFFLRQYKIMLEEFRYYERIKRRREDTYSIYKLITKHKYDRILNSILENCRFEEIPYKLSEGETTEVLELQKIQGENKTVLNQLTELIREVKGIKNE